MKYLLISILGVFFYSCGNSSEQTDTEVEVEEQSDEIKREFSINDDHFQVDSVIANKTKLAGHPWIEISFNVAGFSEGNTTIVKVDVTMDEEKHWIDPPLGDTTGAIVTLINRNEHVVDYYRPLKTGGQKEGFVKISNMTDELLDVEFQALIENANATDSFDDKIELFATFTKVKWQSTNAFGTPLQSLNDSVSVQ